jgi:hypothetical protein
MVLGDCRLTMVLADCRLTEVGSAEHRLQESDLLVLLLRGQSLEL